MFLEFFRTVILTVSCLTILQSSVQAQSSPLVLSRRPPTAHKISFGRFVGACTVAPDCSKVIEGGLKFLSTQKSKVTSIVIDDQKFDIDLPAIGEGKFGVVFKITGEDRVVKIPRGNTRAIGLIKDERAMLDKWNLMSGIQPHSLTSEVISHKEGFYSVRVFEEGETLDKLLFRYGLLNLDDSGNIQMRPAWRQTYDSDIRLQKLWKKLERMMEVVRENPELSLSLSPHNIMVQYADENMAEIVKGTLIDLGFGGAFNKAYQGVKGIEDYINLSLPSMNQDLKLGRHGITVMTFEEAQMHGEFIDVQTLAGDRVRVAGITSNIEEKIEAAIFQTAHMMNLKIKDIFLYGSRVMPRTVVNQRLGYDLMPVLDDGVSKSVIRTGGLTTLSDLEVMVVLDSQEDEAKLREFKSQFYRLFKPKFMAIPMGIRAISGMPDRKAVEDVKAFLVTKGRPYPALQYVSLFEQHTKVSNKCSAAFLERRYL